MLNKVYKDYYMKQGAFIMTSIQSFSLFIIMLNFISSYAMDHSDTMDNSEIYQKFVNVQFANIWNKIDKDHVGVSDCIMDVQWHLKPFVSSCLSMYKGYRLTQNKQQKNGIQYNGIFHHILIKTMPYKDLLSIIGMCIM